MYLREVVIEWCYGNVTLHIFTLCDFWMVVLFYVWGPLVCLLTPFDFTLAFRTLIVLVNH
jgi:hypothetical protein